MSSSQSSEVDGMDDIAHCDYCERTFDDTEDPFTSDDGHTICAHCAAWEWDSLRQQLRGAVSLLEEARDRDRDGETVGRDWYDRVAAYLGGSSTTGGGR